MKKLLIFAVLTAALMISSCGKGSSDPAPSPSISPLATGAAVTASPSAAVSDDGTNSPDTVSQSDETVNNPEAENPDDTDDNTGNDNAAQSDSISIINGSSTTFYAVYLATSTSGNPGENIIGDTPMGSGEEIVLPFANAPAESLTIIVEDENGIQYSAGGINLANGLSIELRLNGSRLEAIVQ